jgi:hypothetical protein
VVVAIGSPQAPDGPLPDLGRQPRMRVAADQEVGDCAVTLGATSAVEGEDSVEVVYLVLPETGREPVALELTRATIEILGRDAHRRRALDSDRDGIEAQAPFNERGVLSRGGDDAWIDEHVDLMFRRQSKDEQSTQQTDLGRGQSRSVGLGKPFSHASSLFSQEIVENLDKTGALVKLRVTPLTNPSIGHDAKDTRPGPRRQAIDRPGADQGPTAATAIVAISPTNTPRRERMRSSTDTQPLTVHGNTSAAQPISTTAD